jgi:hypothetical protein
MNKVKNYFFPPQWDFDHNGPISLGNILADPKSPQCAINKDGQLPLPSFFKNKRIPKFKAKITADSKQSAGLNHSLLSLFGLNADITYERSKTQVYTIEAESRLTQEIDPSAEYVKACFGQPSVKRHFAEKGYKDVYMITGIMTATKATVSNREARRTLFGGRLGISGAAVGVPLGVGVETQNEGGGKAQVEIGASDFVLAYRLRKITYLKVGRVKNMVDVKGKGTVLDGDAKAEELEMEYEAKFVRLEGWEIGAEEFELEGVQARDEEGGQSFEFVIPVKQWEEESESEDGDEK